MSPLDKAINAAADTLAREHPRASYAHEVLAGRQAWSGADLKGKARQYGASYARQRALARKALEAAGGVVVPIERGRLVSAVELEPGRFATAEGVYLRVEGRATLRREGA